MSLKRRGITIATSACVTAVEDTGEGRRVNYTLKGKEKQIESETVIMAVGRRPVIPEGLAELSRKLTADFSLSTPPQCRPRSPAFTP